MDPLPHLFNDEDQDQTVRWADVAHIRDQIKAGTYDTEAKLEAVAERLLKALREGDL